MFPKYLPLVGQTDSPAPRLTPLVELMLLYQAAYKAADQCFESIRVLHFLGIHPKNVYCIMTLNMKFGFKNLISEN